MGLKMDSQPGVLVGWASQDLGNRIVLQLENVSSPPPHRREDVQHTTLLLDKQQALQLGEYLYRASGQTQPSRRKRGLLSRMFAG